MYGLTDLEKVLELASTPWVMQVVEQVEQVEHADVGGGKLWQQ